MKEGLLRFLVVLEIVALLALACWREERFRQCRRAGLGIVYCMDYPYGE